MSYVLSDGGRFASGRKGFAKDCATRAVAIATGMDYDDVYNLLARANKRVGRRKSAREGIEIEVLEIVLKHLGFVQCQAPKFVGRKARYCDLPMGRIIARQAGHVVAVIDGVLHDTFDSSNRMVYKYYLLNKQNNA